MAHGPQGSASLGSLLEMWNFRLHRELLNQNLHCNKIPKEFVRTLKLNKTPQYHTYAYVESCSTRKREKRVGPLVLRWRLVTTFTSVTFNVLICIKWTLNNISQDFYSGMPKATSKE